jgi:hypothetical protein
MPLGMIDGSLVAQLCWAELNLKGTVSMNETAHEHGVRMFVFAMIWNPDTLDKNHDDHIRIYQYILVYNGICSDILYILVYTSICQKHMSKYGIYTYIL